MNRIELGVRIERVLLLEHVHDNLIGANAVPHWIIVASFFIALFYLALIIT